MHLAPSHWDSCLKNQISLHGAHTGAKERHGKLILFCAKTCAGGGALVRSRNSCNSQAGWLQSSNDPYILTFTPQRKEQMQTHKLNHTDLHFKLLERIIIVSGFLGVSAVVPNLRISFPIINHGQSSVHPSPKQVQQRAFLNTWDCFTKESSTPPPPLSAIMCRSAKSRYDTRMKHIC